MHVLRLPLTFLTICGCWMPDSCTSPYRRLLYHAYTAFVLLLITSFLVLQMLDLILIVVETEDFMDNVYMMLIVATACCKMYSVLLNRSNIAFLINILSKNPCSPLEPDEINVRKKFDKLIETNTLYYIILVEVANLTYIIQSLLVDYVERELMYRTWIPFDYSSSVLYSLVYSYQHVASTYGDFLNVGCDSLICGLMLHVCCQIEILNCRLEKIVQNPKILRTCVIHHNLILNFACIVNRKFIFTITVQFIISTLGICVMLYRLTMQDAKIVQFGLHMFAIVTEIFLYCWYGNEVRLKSLQLINNLFEIEWLTLKKEVKKDLLTFSMCGNLPIEFTTAYVIPMNLDSFLSLIKTSYSAYNILQQI